MSDSHDPFDELASAHLDGDTTSEEAARINADPELVERVARFGEVSDRVRATGPSVDETERERAIAAALDAFDSSGEAPEAAGAAASSPVVPLAPRSRVTQAIRWVGVAAALALLALAVPFLDRLDSGSNDQLASEGAATSVAGSGRGAEESPSADALSAAPLSEPADLGSFAGIADLAESVRSQLGAGNSAMETTTAPAVERSTGAQNTACEGEQKSAGGPIIYNAFATLDDQAVLVVVRGDPDGGQTMIVLDRESCTTVSAGKL